MARRAGVSTASVSRVLNHPGKVSAALRERISAAMDELGYVPHGAARALASRRTYTIGTVVPTLGIGIFADQVEALQRRLNDWSYTLVVASSQYDLRAEAQQVRTLVGRGVDGFVLVGACHLPEVYDLLEKKRVPYVNSYVYCPADPHPSIGIDHHAATYSVGRYLLDLGHRRFGIISSPTGSNDRIAARLQGFLNCFGDRGLRPPGKQTLEVPYSISDGRAALRKLMATNPAITAVVCTTDALAIGALLEARSLGLDVPKHLSITGFDDLDHVSHLDPPLTTVRAPSDELGNQIASYLVNRIAGIPVPHATELATTLMVRGSTGPPAG